jgi:hypothetical protein
MRANYPRQRLEKQCCRGWLAIEPGPPHDPYEFGAVEWKVHHLANGLI